MFTERIVEAELRHINNVFKLHPSPPTEHNYGHYRSDPVHIVLAGYPRFPIDVIDSPTHTQHTPTLSAKGIHASSAPIPAIILRPLPQPPQPPQALASALAPMPALLPPKRQKKTHAHTTQPILGKPTALFGPPPPPTWSMVLTAVSGRETLHHPIPIESISRDLPTLPSFASMFGRPNSPHNIIPNPLFAPNSPPRGDVFIQPLSLSGCFNETYPSYP
jgi:hypothetical protein